MKKQPLLPPNRIAEFPPCPWRALFSLACFVSIAAGLYLLSR